MSAGDLVQPRELDQQPVEVDGGTEVEVPRNRFGIDGVKRFASQREDRVNVSRSSLSRDDRAVAVGAGVLRHWPP
jgi:hypothetical protein